MRNIRCLLLTLIPVALSAQSAVDPTATAAAAILERLDRLEKQNEELTAQIKALRAELFQANAQAKASPTAPANAGAPAEPEHPPLEDRVAVLESRVDEQAQTKVEASQRFPISMNGMLLFNAFDNSRTAAATLGTTYLLNGPERAGATMAQTLLGFDFNGPDLPGDGKMSASLSLNLMNGTNAYAYQLTFRRAMIKFDWRRRSFAVGVDKALISERSPDSLAEVTYPALSDAGNPWVWVPQARYTERLSTGENSGVDVQGSVLQTAEGTGEYSVYPGASMASVRPALEGRVNFWKHAASGRKFELAAGFHVSESRVRDYTVPSRFGTVDWLIKPARWVELTGLFFGGENLAVLGGYAEGFTLRYGDVPPLVVHGVGGWAQAAFPVTSRLTFHLFGGMQAPRVADLGGFALTQETEYAANAMYRLGPNVLLGVEALQERALYLEQPRILRNHYDLAIGYLF